MKFKQADTLCSAKPDQAMIDFERRCVTESLKPVVRMLSVMLGPNYEIVLHDLTRPQHSVIDIANGHITGRQPGSSILSGPKDDNAYSALISRDISCGYELLPAYQSTAPDGQELRSMTVIYRDMMGSPFASLCINADMSLFENVHEWLSRVLHFSPAPPPVQKDEPEIDILIEDIITQSISFFGKPVKSMKKAERMYAVKLMMERGLFVVRGGTERAAEALGVTRFTVYNYIEQIKSGNARPAPEK